MIVSLIHEISLRLLLKFNLPLNRIFLNELVFEVIFRPKYLLVQPYYIIP